MADHPPTNKEVDRAQVLIVDDHPAIRQGVRDAVTRTDDLAVCGEASSISEAKQALKAHRPDAVLLDITLEEGSGLELIKDLAAAKKPVPVLVLSMHDENLYAERVLRAGAQGYLMKSEPLSRVVEGLRHVVSGGICLSEKMSGRLLKRVVGGPEESEGASPIESLTDRELEVFEMLGRGQRTHQIADNLHLSIKTIYTHRENIKRKLKLADSTELHQQAFHWVQRETSGQAAGTPSASDPETQDRRET
jgi:DNA-binding NarL/FixJ family response regulator